MCLHNTLYTQKLIEMHGSSIITLHLYYAPYDVICREFSNLLTPAIRPTNTRSITPDFSHNKGNCVKIALMKIHPVYHGVSFHPPFLFCIYFKKARETHERRCS